MANRLDDLEDDVVVEILSRLPVRTLCQLKSVCSRWNAIISSPYLVSTHLKNYTNGPAGDAYQTLMVYDSNRYLKPKIVQFEFDPDGDVSQICYLDSIMPILAGPCNGIYLLGFRETKGHVFLWNPATGSLSSKIPLPRTANDSFGVDSFGFGLHNTVADDFKIVVIRQVPLGDWPYYPREQPSTGCWSSPEFPSQVMVYTLGTGTWRVLEEFRHPLEIVGFTKDYRYGLFFALLLTGNSSGWFSTTVIVTNTRNFHLDQGNIDIVIKGYGGISEAVFTETYHVLLHGSFSMLLIFLAIGIPVLCTAVMYFVRDCPQSSSDDPSEHSHFLFVQGALI
ncbi:unnamed protein product [Linum tenue]|uniref:F-box domain-containing protein n=1 Tax=Linum tenue TaxID=586396 RepID=A0AAV0HTT5_9ROSI|nr:unnamed protein product [Linum tenue]